MASSVFNVPAGTQSAIFQVFPSQSLCAGPALLGGSVLVETASNNQGPWIAWDAGTTTAAASYRPSVNRWARVTASTAAATVVLSDMVASGTLLSSSSLIATASTTSEVILFSFRLPPGLLPVNFRCEIDCGLSLTNNANVKTLKAYVNGVAGTNIFTSGSLASNLNVNTRIVFAGADGSTLKGYGSGLTNLFYGLTTTAYTSLARDFINNETEVAITMTKATGTDTATLDSIRAVIF